MGMNQPRGLRVVEFASFVAAPSAGMTLAQLGADVIKVDPLGGNTDYRRWPLALDSPDSLFWTSLNRGKRSVAVNTRTPEGRSWCWPWPPRRGGMRGSASITPSDGRGCRMRR